MFCRNCGKEIWEDANFCPHCGHREKDESVSGKNPIDLSFISVIVSKAYAKLVKVFESYDAGQIVKIFSYVTLGINLLIRIFSNEVITISYALARDDYYAVSQSGKTWMLMLCALCFAASAGIIWICKRKEIPFEKKSLIPTIIALVISVVAAVIQIPAPY